MAEREALRGERSWREWIDVAALREITKHVTSSAVAMFGSFLLSKLASATAENELSRRFIQGIEEFILTGLLALLGFQLLKFFWPSRRG
jgi:hypothetical protein